MFSLVMEAAFWVLPKSWASINMIRAMTFPIAVPSNGYRWKSGKCRIPRGFKRPFTRCGSECPFRRKYP